MIRLFKFLIFGDSHLCKWEIIDKINIVDYDSDLIGCKYHLQCKQCGNIKIKEDGPFGR